MSTIKFTFTDDNDDEIETEIPAKYDVCGSCHGKGKHDHPAFSNGITADEWNGPDWDDESRESYMAGAYDVTCEECKGLRVILVPDEDRCDKAILKIYNDTMSQKARWDAEDRRTYRMESGEW